MCPAKNIHNTTKATSIIMCLYCLRSPTTSRSESIRLSESNIDVQLRSGKYIGETK